jgi:hypothetical protein
MKRNSRRNKKAPRRCLRGCRRKPVYRLNGRRDFCSRDFHEFFTLHAPRAGERFTWTVQVIKPSRLARGAWGR